MISVPEQLEDAGEESEFIPIFEDDPEQLVRINLFSTIHIIEICQESSR